MCLNHVTREYTVSIIVGASCHQGTRIIVLSFSSINEISPGNTLMLFFLKHYVTREYIVQVFLKSLKHQYYHHGVLSWLFLKHCVAREYIGSVFLKPRFMREYINFLSFS